MMKTINNFIEAATGTGKGSELTGVFADPHKAGTDFWNKFFGGGPKGP